MARLERMGMMDEYGEKVKEVISHRAIKQIMDECENRDDSCTKCPYKVKRTLGGAAWCIFQNVPRDWEVSE